MTELRSVINMNFGDWELFMLVLSAMREDEESLSSSSHETVGDKSRARRKQSNIEEQVARVEATVAGLPSTLNNVSDQEILAIQANFLREAGYGKSDTIHLLVRAVARTV